jgi:hypothetical protein
LHVLLKFHITDWTNESRATTYSRGMCPTSMENGTIFQLNKHKACICAHTMAVVPTKNTHTHSSNGVLFLVSAKRVWITCLKEQCTAALNKNWQVYRSRARYVTHKCRVVGEASLCQPMPGTLRIPCSMFDVHLHPIEFFFCVSEFRVF